MARRTAYSCDICNKEIKPSDTQVFAGVYGLDFHFDCLSKVDGTIIGLLTDEVRTGIQSQYEDRPNHASRLYWNKAVKS